MRRRAFMAGLGAAVVLAPSRVCATGGLDNAPTVIQPQIRVLIATLSAPSAPVPIDDRTFSFNGRRYRGRPTETSLPDGRSVLVTTLPLDDYLYGVVPLEAPPRWPHAMLSAQAIVARTYALGRRSAARGYDVTATDADQHYGGIDAETYPSNLAVDASSGELVTFGGVPANVVYSTCCGGHTADATLVWGHGPFPYLRGVPCTYCSSAPDYRWTKTIPIETFTRALGARAASVGPITNVVPADVDAGGRPASVTIAGEGHAISIGAQELRRLLGYGTLKSAFYRSFSIDRSDRTVTIEGSGSGHGVGLCQWGARGLALEGASAVKIVQTYFPGTSIALATA